MNCAMYLRIAWVLSAVSVLWGLGGCNGGGSYRIVSTEVLRNTEAAKRANREGLEHLAEGRLTEAAEAFEQARKADVEYGPAYNNLGKVYFKQRKWHEAAREFDNAKRLLPYHPGPPNNLGLVFQQAGWFDEAVKQHRQAVNLAPGDVEYAGNLAMALIRRGDETDEVRDLLGQLTKQTTNREWLLWARKQQTRLDLAPE